MTPAALTWPTEAQTRRALAWACSPEHPQVLRMLDGCPDLEWRPAPRACLISNPLDGEEFIEVRLDAHVITISVEGRLMRARRRLTVPPHIFEGGNDAS